MNVRRATAASYSQGDEVLGQGRSPALEGNYSQRLIKLLLLGADLNPANTADVDLVNAWLKAAWLQLTKSGALKPDDNKFALPREHMRFSLVDRAYVCPNTNKLLDTTFKGFEATTAALAGELPLSAERRTTGQIKWLCLS